MTASDCSYHGREQSQIKHFILERYLERFAIIVGKRFDTIFYVDGFSGPWNVQSESLSDASFSIALKKLRSARGVIRERFQRDLKIECLFLEKEDGPFARLKEFADKQTDVKITALNRDFEKAIPDIVSLIHAAGENVFPFVFIDPTGWKGFALNAIAPLLKIKPCEVLINFMTGFVIRFAEDAREEIGYGFEGLFGDASFRDKCQGLTGRDREDALVFEYARRIAAVGEFSHAPVTVVLNPVIDRTHFHLVYATRSLKGVEVFKEAERHALRLTGELRADAKRREREARTTQTEIFSGAEVPETAYLAELSARYGAIARDRVQALIREKNNLPFDDVYAAAMCFPTVQVESLRSWINEIADLENLGPRERVPKLGAGHRVTLRSTDC